MFLKPLICFPKTFFDIYILKILVLNVGKDITNAYMLFLRTGNVRRAAPKLNALRRMVTL